MGYCGLEIVIEDANADREQAIIDALDAWTDEGGWDAVNTGERSVCLEYDNQKRLSRDRLGALWDGEGRDEIARAIWRANGGACYVAR